MRFSSLQAPGIQAMEKGQPWTVPGNQYRSRSSTPNPMLESFQSFVESTEGRRVSPLSPVSIVNSPTDIKATSRLHMTLNLCGSTSPVPEVRIREEVPPLLTVPREAQRAFGGCFDSDNWVFRIVWEAVRHMDLLELLHAYYYREDRGKYGESHTSTRGTGPSNECRESAERKAKGSENHRHQEQGRRVRHRCLQAESDELVSTFTLELAQKMFPRIKADIERRYDSLKRSRDPSPDAGVCQQEVKFRNINGTGKKLGKDDQLTAALVAQHLANILIFLTLKKLEDTRKVLEDAQAVNQVLENKLALKQGNIAKQEELNSPGRNGEALYWRQRFEKSEDERRALEGELVQSRRQSHDERRRNQSSPQPLLPLPGLAMAINRRFDAAEKGVDSVHRTHEAFHEHPAKRRHHGLDLPPIAIHINGLPSPTPSFNGFTSLHAGTSSFTSRRPNGQSAYGLAQRES